MKIITVIGCAILLNAPLVHSANFNVKTLPDNQGYKITGSLVEADVYKTEYPGAGNPVLEVAYQYGPNNGGEARFASWSTRGTSCPQNKTEAIRFINSKLAAGVIANGSHNYVHRQQYSLFISCGWDNSTSGGTWSYDLLGTPFPPKDENQPLCSTTIPTKVDLGSLTVGETASATLHGRTQCDKDAAVKISLLNVSNATTPPGELAIGDARVRYNIDSNGVKKTYSVQAKNGSPFDLNFTVTDTGKVAGDKNGSIILSVEVQ